MNGFRKESTEAEGKINEIFIFPLRKTYPEVSAQLLINHKVNVMVGCSQ